VPVINGREIVKRIVYDVEVVPWSQLATPLHIIRGKTMAIVTTINPVAGGDTDTLQIVDSTPAPNTNKLPNAAVSWSGLAAGVTMTANADGVSWVAAAAASAAAGSAVATFTYAGPSDLANPSSPPVTITGSLTINVTAGAVTNPIVEPLQVDLISGP
jgi:hypothetical protein